MSQNDLFGSIYVRLTLSDSSQVREPREDGRAE